MLRLLLGLVLLLAGPAPAHAAVVWAVGDGAGAGPHDDAVAELIQREGADRLLYLGDVYETGTAAEYRDVYAPGYGRLFHITSPTPGNHEWEQRAVGYDPYWGARAPRSGGHWYQFDLDGWKVLSLNTEEPIGEGSPQLDWVRRVLASTSGTCTLAFFHHPRSSAGPHERSSPALDPLWRTLAGRASIALSGHDHNFQRHRPDGGVTQFVVGTGGRDLLPGDAADPRLASHLADRYGALRMDLRPGRATFAFVGVDGSRPDAGTIGCTPPQGLAPAPSAPGVRITSPRDRAVHTRSLTTVAGTAALRDGVTLGVTVTRRRGGRCRALGPRGFTDPCARPRLVAVRGTARWRLRLPGRPAAGSYRVVARALRGTTAVARTTVRFRVR